MRAPKLVKYEGKLWYPVGSAARRLRTSATKVRELMGKGTLEWCQRGGYKTLLVSADSVNSYLVSPANPKRSAPGASFPRSKDPLARRSTDLPKLGDREEIVPRGFGVFAPTWDPATGRKKPSKL